MNMHVSRAALIIYIITDCTKVRHYTTDILSTSIAIEANKKGNKQKTHPYAHAPVRTRARKKPFLG